MTQSKKSIAASQVTPGMIINVNKKLFLVEGASKTSLPRGGSFMKVTLKNLVTGKESSKNFKLNQTVDEVQLEARRLEFLYLEEKKYLFLDINSLEKVLIEPDIVEEK